MSQYNLITAGSLNSSTTLGTGNKLLTSQELLSLYNGNTTSSGITIVESDLLYLDFDMGYRVVMDNVKLFIDVPGDRDLALINVDFYYKNNESDVFVLCSKGQDSTMFYQITPTGVFAPRYVRVIIDSLQATIYELKITNDDTQVTFGPTGNETLVFLSHLTGGSTSLGIYNNSAIGTTPVNAYISIDYQGKDSDYYVKLSNASDGNYYGISDGVALKDNDLTSAVIWDRGSFDGVELIPTTENITTVSYPVSYYTTPIIKMDDLFDATFIISNVKLTSASDITYDTTIPEGTIKVRSSNISPIPFSKLFWTYKNTDNKLMVFEGDMLTGNKLPNKLFINTSASIPQKVIFDKFNGHFITIEQVSGTPNNTNIIRKFSYTTGQQLYESSSVFMNNIAANMGVDISGQVWGYSQAVENAVIVYSYDLTTYTIVFNGGETTFLNGLSVDKQLPSCWYTSTSKSKVSHVQYDGLILASISVVKPTHICSIGSGGCIVVSDNQSKVSQYSSYGTLLSEFDYTGFVDIIGISYGFDSASTEYDTSEFWMLLLGGQIVKLSFSGSTVVTAIIPTVTSIEAFPGGCLAFESSNKVYQLNNEGHTSRIWDFSSYTTKGFNAVPVVINYNEFLLMPSTEKLMPTPYDPVWGDDIGWNEVSRSGYKLPMKTYHQIKYRLLPEVISIQIINPEAEDGITGWLNEGASTFEITTVSVWQGSYAFKLNSQGPTVYQLIELSTIIGIDIEKVDLGYYYINLNTMARLSTLYTDNYISVTIEFYDLDMRIIYSYISEKYSTLVWTEINLDALVSVGTRYIKLKLTPYTSSYNFSYYDLVSSHMYIKPVLESVVIPKPVQISDLQPQEYKNIYIKTEFPEDAPFQEYDTILKCWWGNENQNQIVDRTPLQSFLSRNDGVSLSSVKSVIFDFENIWYDHGTMAIRSIEFTDAAGDVIDLVSIGFIAYASSESDLIHSAVHAFDNTLSKVGNEIGTSWAAESNVCTYQRLICVMDTTIPIYGVIINNYHYNGQGGVFGVKNIKIYISSSDEVTESLYYNAPVAYSMLVFDGIIEKHVEADVVDDQVLILDIL